MEYLNDAIKQLLALGPEALLICVVIALGYVLKRVPLIPNKTIPAACLLLGAGIYPLITSPGQAPPDIKFPIVREIMLGLLIGFIAWIIHNKLLKRIEERVPWLKGVLSGNGDTELVEKLKDAKHEPVEHNGPDV